MPYFSGGNPSVARSDLGAAFEQYQLDADLNGFVGLRLMPAFESAAQSGQYGVLALAELKKKVETSRAAGAGYSRSTYKVSQATFATQEYGHEEPVDERMLNIYGSWFDAETVAAMRCRSIVMEAAEARIVAAITAAVTNTTAAGTVWSTTATASPITNVDTAKKAIRDRTGLIPNTVCMSWNAFQNARNCAQVVDRIKYQGFQDARAGNITAQAMAAVFDVQNVIVSGVMKNSANEGATASMADIWTNTEVLVCRVSNSPILDDPCLGRVIHWSGDGSEIGGTFETYDEVQTRSRVVRLRHDVQELVLYGGLGQRITGVL